MQSANHHTKPSDIAIIGIAGKYPQANSPDELWHHILTNKNLVSSTGDESAKQGFVDKYFALDRIENFDHKRFKFTPLEAELTDPQHRILLTCSYLALLDAGYLTEPSHLKFGVFATTSLSSYLLNILLESKHYKKGEINYPILIGNDKDFLATKIAYKFNFTGPALTIQCACSSSLVALHHACQSLLKEECDLTVVGGVSISVPQNQGYFYKEGGILSQDGICRPFDASASGTIKGNGCSVIILKRLSCAVRDQDKIYAVIKGTAINNDGANKVGFTAPAIQGQADCIQRALLCAGLASHQIDYIEAHGTGTKLGDLIELAALNQVFGNTNKKIPIGSLKANIGHLDVAAGLSSVIKLTYVLKNGIVPPIQHFQTLNPDLKEFSHPFDFPTRQEKAHLINGSVSSFGIGGTNAHVVLSKYEPQTYCVHRPCLKETPLEETEFWVRPENESTSSPQKDVLNEVIEIWIQAIGEKSIHPNSQYVKLGGDSLAALEIVDQLKKRFSITFALSDFTQDTTPLKLTERIKDQTVQKSGPSLFIQIKKLTRPSRSVFLLHPAGGTTFCYYFLMQALKGEYNVFVIDLPTNYSQFQSMSDLGAHYVKEMKKLQPEGPYYLGGYSFGGNLSYEMAIQLQNRGESVAKIILFDSHLPEAYTLLSETEIHYQSAFSKILTHFDQKQKLNEESFNFFYNKWIFSHQLLKNHHQTGKVLGDIILFIAREKEDAAILNELAIANVDKKLWKNRSRGQFKQIHVPGNHYTMFDAHHVCQLANHFNEEIL